MTEELDRLTAAFRAADQKAQQGDEQARADAALFAREIRRLQQADSQGGLTGAMNTVNEGIARGLGAPVDLVSGGLRRLGFDTGDAPVGGAESIRSAMRVVGAQPIDREPENMRESLLMGAGEAAGALLPVGLTARAAQGAGGVTGAVATDVMSPFVNTPARAMAAEAAAGAGARAGERIVNDAAGDERFGALGALAGGLVAGAGPAALTRAAGATARALPVTGAAIRGVNAAVAPFTQAGAAARAQDRVRNLLADPEEAARILSERPISDVTPAQQLNDPNALALERSAANADPRLRDDLAERANAASTDLEGEFAAPAQGATSDEFRAFAERRRETFRQSLAARVDQARERAQERIQRLDPARRESENSLIVRAEIESAFEAAKAQEQALWARVPQDARVETRTARDAFQNISRETGAAQRSDIPREASALLGDGQFGEVETVREMYSLYSRMRQVAREASSGTAPNRNRERIANQIADAILQDLGAVDGLTAAGRAINDARSYTREMKEIFDQGAVGFIRSQRRSGSDAVPPEASLARTVGPGGAAASVASRQIQQAAGPAAQDPIEDFLRNRLMDRADRNGFRPESADAFVRANRETLMDFPELMGDIGGAQQASRELSRVDERVSRLVTALDNPRENVTAAFLAANSGDEIAQAIFRTRNPAAAAEALRRQAARDRSGQALNGLKSAFLDHLMAQARSSFDTTGQRQVAGNTLFGNLQDSRVRSAMSRIFEPEEMRRLDSIAREFQGIEGARRSEAFPAVMEDTPNSVISLLARTIAARQGAKAGQGTSGASLLTANFASRRMQEILYRLTNDQAEKMIMDAVQDRELFLSLINRSAAPAAVSRRENRLREWLIANAGLSASDFANDDQE
jgi:hypothetical protein